MPLPRFLRNKKKLHRVLSVWYRRNARPFPWRKTSDPYRILVSEIMAQQTRIDRVEARYPVFLKEFPGLGALAGAPRSAVVRAWRGMGYNSRAIRLHELAQRIGNSPTGKLPETPEELLGLPGIGPYTAHAIACFAFGRRVPIVDTNIRRIIERLSGRRLKEPDLWSTAELLLPPRKFNEWNQALMDLGALVCTANSPSCGACPFAPECRSAFSVRKSKSRRPKSEPGRNGIPNRIYRGRIVEALRDHPRGQSVRLKPLASKIGIPITAGNLEWLTALLTRLEKDGLVSVRRRRDSVSARLAD